MSDPDKVLMQIIDTMLPILTGAMRSTVTGLLDEAYAQGVADERARVVAYLRSDFERGTISTRATVRKDVSLEIERGDHEEKP